MIVNSIFKRATTLWLLFFISAGFVKAQKTDKVYKIVYQMPEYTGGVDSLSLFLRENVKYPYEDRLNKNEGVVYISFVIEKDGSLSNIEIDEKASKNATLAMKTEAVRVINSMPNWQPGRFDDETPARVSYELPIGFYMGEPKRKKRR
ncbi:MAG: TonB family protein [Bacteroidia bacterium]